jgi:hypothetical protein
MVFTFAFFTTVCFPLHLIRDDVFRYIHYKVMRRRADSIVKDAEMIRTALADKIMIATPSGQWSLLGQVGSCFPRGGREFTVPTLYIGTSV